MNEIFWEGFEEEAKLSSLRPKGWGDKLEKGVYALADKLEDASKVTRTRAMKTPNSAFFTGALAGGTGMAIYNRSEQPKGYY